MHPPGDAAARRGQGDDEGAPVGRPDRTGDQLPLRDAVQDARERRALVGEHAVELADRSGARGREMGEDVGLTLGETLRQVGEVEPDPVGRSMDGRDEA